MKKTAFIALLALVAIGTVLADGEKVDYQKLADRTEFRWRQEESTILYSLCSVPRSFRELSLIGFRMDREGARRC